MYDRVGEKLTEMSWLRFLSGKTVYVKCFRKLNSGTVVRTTRAQCQCFLSHGGAVKVKWKVIKV